MKEPELSREELRVIAQIAEYTGVSFRVSMRAGLDHPARFGFSMTTYEVIMTKKN